MNRRGNLPPQDVGSDERDLRAFGGGGTLEWLVPSAISVLS